MSKLKEQADLKLDAHAVHELFSMWDKEVPSVDELRRYFTDDLVFEDPLQHIEGLEAYWEMNERLLKKNTDLKITMEESAQNGPHIMFTYSLSMSPSKKMSKMLSVTGMTYVRLNDEGKIEYHRDYWDFNSAMLSMFPRAQRWYKRFVSIFA